MASSFLIPTHSFFTIDQENQVLLSEDYSPVAPMEYKAFNDFRFPAFYLIRRDKRTPVEESFYDMLFISEITQSLEEGLEPTFEHTYHVDSFLDYHLQMLDGSMKRKAFLLHLNKLLRESEKELYEVALKKTYTLDEARQREIKYAKCYNLVWAWISKTERDIDFVGQPGDKYSHKEQVLAFLYALELGIINSPTKAGVDQKLYNTLIFRLFGRDMENTKNYINAKGTGRDTDPKKENYLLRLQNDIEKLGISGGKFDTVMGYISKDLDNARAKKKGAREITLASKKKSSENQ